MVHVLDADSSQSLVIEEAKRGRNLVIQGPPGTGKSQTIANLIAAAVKEGKSVLFVAEKMAALEVVHRRLANVGLGDMCLELHSNKANKRAVLQDLERTLNLGPPHVEDVHRHCDDLSTCRDRLNGHLQVLHTPIQPSGLTPYQVIGELVRLRAANTRLADFVLDKPTTWTRAEFQNRRNLLRDLVDHVEAIDRPSEHCWRGAELDVVLPTDVDRIAGKIPAIVAGLESLQEAGNRLAEIIGVSTPANARDLLGLARLGKRLNVAPPMDRQSLASDLWQDQRQQIDDLVESGCRLAECRQKLKGVVSDVGWKTDVTRARRAVAAHGRSWFPDLPERVPASPDHATRYPG